MNPNIKAILDNYQTDLDALLESAAGDPFYLINEPDKVMDLLERAETIVLIARAGAIQMQKADQLKGD
ncbi:MAG: hypothetical protein LRY55_03940 [Leadbetterella sp.]|nr:hypothetical protein [Leadbetterella sp.]